MRFEEVIGQFKQKNVFSGRMTTVIGWLEMKTAVIGRLEMKTATIGQFA